MRVPTRFPDWKFHLALLVLVLGLMTATVVGSMLLAMWFGGH